MGQRGSKEAAERAPSVRLGWSYHTVVRTVLGDSREQTLAPAEAGLVYFGERSDGTTELCREPNGLRLLFVLIEDAEGISLAPASSDIKVICNEVAVTQTARLASFNSIQVSGYRIQLDPRGFDLSGASKASTEAEGAQVREKKRIPWDAIMFGLVVVAVGVGVWWILKAPKESPAATASEPIAGPLPSVKASVQPSKEFIPGQPIRLDLIVQDVPASAQVSKVEIYRKVGKDLQKMPFKQLPVGKNVRVFETTFTPSTDQRQVHLSALTFMRINGSELDQNFDFDWVKAEPAKPVTHVVGHTPTVPARPKLSKRTEHRPIRRHSRPHRPHIPVHKSSEVKSPNRIIDDGT
ncbi:MAG TPA: hypothetical protein VG944_05955 [Fimbriimonas sp.]|nr:hypothetical protein [Fimbriimonas sp.]